MRKTGHILIILMLVLSGFVLKLSIEPVKVSAYTPHDPIDIYGNDDFATQAASEGWPGDGTEGNPYIIEEYDINATYSYCIGIISTNVFFIIRDSIIRNGSIFIYNTSNGMIKNCTFKDPSFISGIDISCSSKITITDTTIVEGGISLEGSQISHWNTHNISTSNTIDGKPIYYLKNQKDGIIPYDASQVILANCSNIIVENQELSKPYICISAGYSSNLTIRNNSIDLDGRFGDGIYLFNCSNNYIQNNIIKNSYDGIRLEEYSKDNNIIGNNISNNDMGIYISRSSDGNSIIENIIQNNSYGIYLRLSNSSKMTNNIMVNNGIVINGQTIGNWNTHVIDTSNTVNGKPVYYWKNQNGGEITQDTGQVILANCTNVEVANQEIAYTSYGISIGFSTNCMVVDNICLFNGCGFYLGSGSNGNTIQNNEAYYNDIGLYFSSSWENIITKNNFTFNEDDGIHLSYSEENYIIGNKFNKNRNGMELYNSDSNIIINNSILSSKWAGINLHYSNENNIINNEISSNYDVGIGLYNSENNSIEGNLLSFNKYGIYFDSSPLNNITNNIVSFNWDGISMGDYSNFNAITNNTISNNDDGILINSCNRTNIAYNNIISQVRYGIYIAHCRENNIIYNNISNNDYGVFIWDANNNTFHHNRILENREQLDQRNSSNTWDNSNSEGNYWSDYNGVDKDGDGVGDTDLPHQGVDYFPLTDRREEEKFHISSVTGILLLIWLAVMTIIVILALLTWKKQRQTKPPPESEPQEFPPNQPKF